MNCATCKHWEKHKGDYYSGWVKKAIPGDYGMCWNENESMMLSICAGEGILGELITHESFGCLQFETKESSAKVPSEQGQGDTLTK